MIETDLLHAYAKTEDRLKTTAHKIVQRIMEEEFNTVYASREALHEIYYVSMEEGTSIDEYIARAASLTAIENLAFLETTPEIDLLALALMSHYNIGSIFDAYHAASALNQDPDHTLISTDKEFDKTPGIKRIDPRDL